MTCDYCPWPAVQRVTLRRSAARALLGREPLVRFACGRHVRRAGRR